MSVPLPARRLAPLAGVTVGCLLVGVAFALPAAASAPPNTIFGIGIGSSPSVALGPDGTAYIAFDHNQNVSSDDDSVQLCRIPRGHRGCAALTTVILPDFGVGGDGPKVIVPATGTVQLISSRESDQTTADNLIYLVTSTDNGATFGAPVALGRSGVAAPSTVSLGNGRFASISRDGTAGSFVEGYGPAGTPPDTNSNPISPDEYGGSLALTADGTLLAAHYDSPAGTPNVVTVQRYSGTGPISSPASWSTVFTTPGDLTQLAKGSSGTFLLDRRDSDNSFEVRKWTGSGFAGAVIADPGKGDENYPSLTEDSNGRVTVVYRRDGALVITSSTDGSHFSAARVLAPEGDNSVYNPQALEAPDGGGFAAFDSDGDGKVFAVAIPKLRHIGGHVTKGLVSGFDNGAVKGQPVRLQEKGAHGYFTLKTGKFGPNGSYSFTLPKFGKKVTLRIVAPAVEGYALDQSKPLSVTL